MRNAARRLLPFAAMAALVLLLGGLASAEPTTKVFDAHNFKWTVPDGWDLSEFSDADQALGYIIRATGRKDDAYVVADVRVKATEGLSIQEMSDEVRNWHSQQMTTLQGSKTREGSLSGIKGTEVLVKGEDETGAGKLVRAYTIEAGGQFHQVIFKLYNGADATMAAQVDEARRGYRLLKGAGPMEQEAKISDGDDDGGTTGTPDNWPEKGPKIDDGTLLFPSHNMNWKLPKQTKLQLTGIIDDEERQPEEGKNILLVAFKGTEPREAKKDGEPTQNTIDVRFFVGKERPGFDANGLVQNSGLHNNLAEQMFDSVEFGRTKATTDHEIGNFTGGRLAMAGRKAENVRFFVLYVLGLKGRVYECHVRADGGRRAFSTFQNDVKELMAGIEFLDTAEWITGPAGVQGVPPFSIARGDSVDEERDYTSVGFTVVKPEGMASLAPSERKHPNLRYAWEMRTEDKQKYFYFDIHSFPLRGNEGDMDEEIVKQRELQWKEIAQNPETVKRGRTPWFKDRLGRGKGLGYEFVGFIDDVPFLERGYVVKYKKYLYWVRFQFGGKGAEKQFSKLQKTIAKSIKF